ncbi:hypothetical protein SAZ11_27430 [Streptomyces sp. FXJ1.4098]|nr:hypothetical protein [Streptomyces sp. FXJ1.4098]
MAPGDVTCPDADGRAEGWVDGWSDGRAEGRSARTENAVYPAVATISSLTSITLGGTATPRSRRCSAR